MTVDLELRTCLWFHSDGEAAAHFYTSLIPSSSVTRVFRSAPDAPALIIDFTLAGVPYQILNGGPQYTLTEAASISVTTPDQAETDRLWDALTADGGRPSRCGWLVDRFGVSWQIVPAVLGRILGDPDRAAAGRAMQAMLQMAKLDVAQLEAAFRGE
ncbi:MAG: VOC family protein [Planctomycetota bacterium]